MTRLLTLLMIVALVIGHGISYAAAVCRHHSAQEHALARQSHDAKTAASATAEEEAASAVSKKGTRSGTNMAAWAADMLPRPVFEAPFRVVDAIPSHSVEPPALHGTTVAPLLRPPLFDAEPLLA